MVCPKLEWLFYRSLTALGLIITFLTGLSAQGVTCRDAFTLGPDIILCEPQTQTVIQVQTDWTILNLDWLAAPQGAMTDSLTWAVTTTGTETAIAEATIRSPNLVTNGDFNAGNSGFSSDMLYNPFTLIIPGSYTITNAPATVHPDFKPCGDHTTGNGNQLACNGSLFGDRDIWCKTIPVEPGGAYELGFWASALTENESAELVFRLDGQDQTVPNLLGPTTCEWLETTMTWTAGAQTSVEVCIRNLNGSNTGNDFAIDDIRMHQICTVRDTVQVRYVPQASSQIDTLLCSGDTLAVAGQLITRDTQMVIHVPEPWGCDSLVFLHAVFWTGQMTVVPPPVLTCLLDTVQLSVTSDPGPGSLGFQWFDQNGLEIPGAVFPVLDVSHSGTYVVRVTLTASSGSCSRDAQVLVPEDRTAPMVDAGPDQVITCLQDSLVLQPGTFGPGADLAWRKSETSGDLPLDGEMITIGESGQYILEARDSTNGCLASDTVQVTDVRTVPNGLEVLVRPPFCRPDDGRIDLLGLSGASGAWTAELLPDGPVVQGPSGFVGLVSGDHRIRMTDGNGCVWDTVLVIPETGSLMLDLPPELELEAGTGLSVVPKINIPDSLVTGWSWTTTTGLILDCDQCKVVQVNGLESGYLNVCVSLTEDCEICAVTYIHVDRPWTAYVPEVFSPNADGINDVFLPQVNPAIVSAINRLEVFDRWGDQVWSEVATGSNPIGWHGEFRGSACPPGVYVWKADLKLIDGSVTRMQGEILLVR